MFIEAGGGRGRGDMVDVYVQLYNVCMCGVVLDMYPLTRPSLTLKPRTTDVRSTVLEMLTSIDSEMIADGILDAAFRTEQSTVDALSRVH